MFRGLLQSLAQGLLAGVHARTTTGRGQRVATSLLHALVTYDMISGYGHRIHTPQEGGKAYGVMPLGFMTAETKDGRYLQMCSRAPHLFRNWMRAIGLELFAERGFELATLDEVALAAGFTKGAIYRHFPSKGAFLLALFEQYAAVARAGSGARQATWFVPLTVQFAAQATRDPLLRRRLATVLSEAPDGSSPEGQLLKALARIWPA